MKIKIIDLLNMIAKGEEVPEKIKYKDMVYEWKRNYGKYFMGNNSLGGYLCLDGILKNEVEIIEEPKKIEKIEIETDGNTNNFYIRNEFGTKCYLTKHSKIITEKLNELIDKVIEMSKND